MFTNFFHFRMLCDCEFVCEPSEKSLLLQDIINPVNRTAIIALALHVDLCLFIIKLLLLIITKVIYFFYVVYII